MVAVETVTALIDQRELHTLRDTLIDSAPVEIAELFQSLSDEQRVLIFRILPRDVAADIFAELDVDLQRNILSGLGDKHTARLLYEMAADDRTALLEEIPAEAARQLLALLPKEVRDVALTLLGYPEGSVGRLMSPDYLTIREDWKVREVLDHIRVNGQESDSLDTLYVVDSKGTLVDEVTVKTLLLASPDDEVASLMNYKFEALSVQSDQEQAVELFKKYDRPTLPVVDQHGVLLGIVTKRSQRISRSSEVVRLLRMPTSALRWRRLFVSARGGLSFFLWARCSPLPRCHILRMRFKRRWCSRCLCP